MLIVNNNITTGPPLYICPNTLAGVPVAISPLKLAGFPNTKKKMRVETISAATSKIVINTDCFIIIPLFLSFP